jgi:enoyl-CoA hydratase
MSLISIEDMDGGVRVLRIDNGKANAFATPLSEELIAALDAAEQDADAVVIAGRAGMFSAGFDLGTMAEGPAAAAKMVTTGGHMLMKIFGHPKPIVAACTGHAIAMGLFTMMACDYRVGARGPFKLGANETAIGMTLPTFALEVSKARISRRHLNRALVQATIYDPDGALDAGMLDELVEADHVETRAIEIATALGALPQPAFRNNKRLIQADIVRHVLDTLEENVGASFGS